jgi:DNA polymerase III subunit epsilon
MTTLAEIPFCVVDTETTGGRAELHRVSDVAVFVVQDGIILDRFQTLLNPGRPIPEWITMLTGIDDSMVKNAPTFADIAPVLRDKLAKGVFVAHNVGFDRRFLQEEFARLGDEWRSEDLCTLRLARHLFPELPSRSLGFLCEHLLVDIYDRHRAAGDAEATVYVLKEMLRQLREKHAIQTWSDLQLFEKVGPLVLPNGISLSEIRDLPKGKARYEFRGGDNQVLIKGNAQKLYQRICTYFRRSNLSPRSQRLREEARSLFVEAIYEDPVS